MLTPPASPFTTADFSPQGGGIDFLGLRWVSLTSWVAIWFQS